MTAWRAAAVVLVMVPWAGCLDDGVPASVRVGLFAFELVERGQPDPVPVRSCAELLGHLNGRAIDEARVYLAQSVANQYTYYGGGDVMAVAAEDSTAAATGTASPKSAAQAQVTGTNNQEAAADEGDLVKTDGEWTYVLSGGVLHILRSKNVGDVEAYAEMDLGQAWGGELLLERRDARKASDDRLIVVLPWQSAPVESDANDAPKPGGLSISPAGGMTRILVLSLADRRSPQIEDEVWVEGEPRASRLVDGHAYVVVHTWAPQHGLRTYASPNETDLDALGLDWQEYYRLPDVTQKNIREHLARQADKENLRILEDLKLQDHLPTILRSNFGALRPDPRGEAECRRVSTTDGSTGRSFTTILAFAVGGAKLASSTTQVMGGSSTVYASENALVLAAPSQDSWWYWAQPDLEEATDLQWFDLDGLDVAPKASGRILGTVLDSFSLDVEGDELRVATTTGTWGRWWDDGPEPMMSHVATFTTMAGVLVTKGIVGGIAPGEKIWSARFTADRAYLVTFRQTDPLWVIDLSGAKPTILGELEIPGVSTYIHPVDDETLLTIGLGPNGDGNGLDWSRVQVSLFDLSNLKKPRRADVLDLTPSEGWSWSSATHEHKAFTYWPEIGTLAVPLSTSLGYESSASWKERSHIGLHLIDVDLEAKELRRGGEVDQDDLLSDGRGYGTEIQRSYFLGYPDEGPVSVYAISALGVTAHDLPSLEPQGSVAFEPR